jgi:hypothetical protein
MPALTHLILLRRHRAQAMLDRMLYWTDPKSANMRVDLCQAQFSHLPYPGHTLGGFFGGKNLGKLCGRFSIIISIAYAGMQLGKPTREPWRREKEKEGRPKGEEEERNWRSVGETQKSRGTGPGETQVGRERGIVSGEIGPEKREKVKGKG